MYTEWTYILYKRVHSTYVKYTYLRHRQTYNWSSTLDLNIYSFMKQINPEVYEMKITPESPANDQQLACFLIEWASHAFNQSAAGWLALPSVGAAWLSVIVYWINGLQNINHIACKWNKYAIDTQNKKPRNGRQITCSRYWHFKHHCNSFDLLRCCSPRWVENWGRPMPIPYILHSGSTS